MNKSKTATQGSTTYICNIFIKYAIESYVVNIYILSTFVLFYIKNMETIS